MSNLSDLENKKTRLRLQLKSLNKRIKKLKMVEAYKQGKLTGRPNIGMYKEVCELRSQGLSFRQIGTRLGISTWTVRSRLK